MRRVTKKQIERYKSMKDWQIAKIVDYTMNTRYWRVVEPKKVWEELDENLYGDGKGGLATYTKEAETLGASANPLEALKLMTSNAELWEIEI